VIIEAVKDTDADLREMGILALSLCCLLNKVCNFLICQVHPIYNLVLVESGSRDVGYVPK